MVSSDSAAWICFGPRPSSFLPGEGDGGAGRVFTRPNPSSAGSPRSEDRSVVRESVVEEAPVELNLEKFTRRKPECV